VNSVRTRLCLALALCCTIGLSAAAAAGTTAPSAPTTQAIPVASQGDDMTGLSLEDLMNVEVTSVSKSKQSIADAPAAVTVISQDDIARSGFSTIPDLLRLVPGMDVGQVDGSTWAVSARGLNSEYANSLLVLQDGRTVYSPVFGGVVWNTVDYILPDLDRIEVIRGPGATLWGANAFNGVVNITSKDAEETQGLYVATRGSNEDSSLEARYGAKLSDDTYYRVYAKGRYDTGLDQASDGGSNGDPWSAYQDGFRIDKHASDHDVFTLQGDLSYSPLNIPTNVPTFVPPFTRDQTLHAFDNAGNIMGRWTHTQDERNGFSLQAYDDYALIDDGLASFSRNSVDLDFQDKFGLGASNEVTWGAGYRFTDANAHASSLNTLTLDPSASTDNVCNAFLQDAITLVPDQWVLTLGSKLEHNDPTGFDLDPSARLMWTPDATNSFWAAISRATQTPSLVDEYIRNISARLEIPSGTSYSPAEVLLSGDPNFQSAQLTAYELGYRAQVTKQVSIDVAAYYDSYSNMESVQQGAPIPGPLTLIPLSEANGIDGSIYGGEISTQVQVTPAWKLEASYSLLEASFHPKAGSADTADATHDATSSPQNMAQIHSYLDVTKNLQLNASVYYVDRIREFNVPAYISTDLNVSWQINEAMNLTVGVNDLFDPEHPEFGSTGNLSVAGQVPRTVYAQLSYRF
jgi:iron complex outermembrane receptor protein